MSEYWESYKSSLLLHTLNIYFGSKKFTQTNINDYVNDYVVHLKSNYNIDYVYDEKNMNKVDFIPITSYIASKNDKNTFYYITDSPTTYLDLLDNIKCFFVYTSRTMYVVKCINKIWYKYDSLTGINKCDVAQIMASPKNMFIVPLKNLDKYLEYTTRDLKNYLIENKVLNGDGFIEYYANIESRYMILLGRYFIARKNQNENQSLELPISLYYDYNNAIIKYRDRLVKDKMDFNDVLGTTQYYMINYLRKKYLIS